MTLTGPTPKTPAGWARKVPPVLTSMDVEGVESLSGERPEQLRLRPSVGVVLHIDHGLLVCVRDVEDVVPLPPDLRHSALGRGECDPDGLGRLPARGFGSVLRDFLELDVVDVKFVGLHELLPALVVGVLTVLQE